MYTRDNFLIIRRKLVNVRYIFCSKMILQVHFIAVCNFAWKFQSRHLPNFQFTSSFQAITFLVGKCFSLINHLAPVCYHHFREPRSLKLLLWSLTTLPRASSCNIEGVKVLLPNVSHFVWGQFQSFVRCTPWLRPAFTGLDFFALVRKQQKWWNQLLMTTLPPEIIRIVFSGH